MSKHESLSNNTEELIEELERWASNREYHNLDSTPLKKAIILLTFYMGLIGSVDLRDLHALYQAAKDKEN
jgi:hypothetical protein